MKLLHRSANERQRGTALRRPAPNDPVELGFALRARREQLGLHLDQVRNETDVPIVDLDALERGRLETLHTQHAAQVALFRYAERLGLEPTALAAVIQQSWPTRALAVDAFRSPSDITPVAALHAANQLLLPMTAPRQLTSGARTMGLSDATKRQLARSQAKKLFAQTVLAAAKSLRSQRTSSGDAASVATKKARPKLAAPSKSKPGLSFPRPSVADAPASEVETRRPAIGVRPGTGTPEAPVELTPSETDTNRDEDEQRVGFARAVAERLGLAESEPESEPDEG